MCGIAGYVGMSELHREDFVNQAGVGIDNRGGDSSGYLSVNRATQEFVVGKRVGTWSDSKWKFRRRAAAGDLLIAHARWATCGVKTKQEQAHPFEIVRNGEVKLRGAHNGCIWNAKESCVANGRPFTVDSKELFELMVDGDVEAIRELEGYGVITWHIPGTDHVNMVRLSDTSEICVVKLYGGGVAWASTWEILKDALEHAGLEAEAEYQIPIIGMVYQFKDTGVYRTTVTGICFDTKPQVWEDEVITKWEREQEEDEAKSYYMELLKETDQENNRDISLYSSWERDMDNDEDIEYPRIRDYV